MIDTPQTTIIFLGSPPILISLWSFILTLPPCNNLFYLSICCVRGTVLITIHMLSQLSFSEQFSEIGIITIRIIPTLKMSKLRLREVNSFTIG